MAYKLEKFTPQRLAATDAAWRRQASRSRNPLVTLEYERILRWTADCSKYDGKDTETFAYGVFDGTALNAAAVTEVVYTRSGLKWLKLLNLHLSPEVDLSFNKESLDILALSSIFTAAIVGTLELTKHHPANTVKLYGRSGSLLTFLKGVGGYIEKNGGLPGLRVGIEGRWLVVKARG